MNEKGFSLIELLTVLAIVGILLGFGIHSYSGTRISTQARLDRYSLLNLPLALEVYFSKQLAYPASLELVWDYQTQGKFHTAKKYYLIQYTLHKDQNYTINALINPNKPNTDQLDCIQLTLQSNGELIALNADSQEISGQCW